MPIIEAHKRRCQPLSWGRSRQFHLLLIRFQSFRDFLVQSLDHLLDVSHVSQRLADQESMMIRHPMYFQCFHDLRNLWLMIEAAAPNALLRRGWTKNSLPAGTEILVEGFQAKGGGNKANGRMIAFTDGRKLFVGSSGDGAPQLQEKPASKSLALSCLSGRRRQFCRQPWSSRA